MKIKNLKINGYGKLKDKDIEFGDKINLISGYNESGKSTLLNFIVSMLYGANRNKNGKDISNFDKYKPWDGSEFSGKIKYELDNNETYEIYRDFIKKNPKIYNKNLEDITSNFDNDKSKGINFLYEQTKVDEELFLNSLIVAQESVKLNKSEQISVIQKISNAVSTGNGNVSYKKSLEKMNKKLNLEVGTNRTSEKPINVLNAELEELNNKKNNLLEAKLNKINVNEEKVAVEKEIVDNEYRNKLLKKVKNIFEKYNIKYAEINLDKNVKQEADEKINKLNNDVEILNKEKQNSNLKNKSRYLLIALVLLLIIVITYFFKLNFYVYVILVICFAISIGLYICNKVKIRNVEKKKLEKIEKRIAELKNEIKIIEENKDRKLLEIKDIEEKLLIEKESDKNNLKNEFSNYFSNSEIDSLFEQDYSKLLNQSELLDEKLNRLKIKQTTLDIESKNINNELQDLSQIEEKIDVLNDKKRELDSLSKSINLAKECLNLAYQQMKERISPKFINNLTDVINKISNGKYKNINFSDTEGLQVELPNGDYILADRLSTGTIEQMYLALRINILNEITEEKMPIILDESFVYYDSERLENIIKYLDENLKNQIIIFSCSEREKQILNKLHINYKLVEI